MTTRAPIAVSTPRFKTVIFDVDSTVAAIEGIDWLAAQRDEAVARRCAELTQQAMAGEIPLEDVYVRRLAAIRPTGAELLGLAGAYMAAIEPGAIDLIAALRAAQCHVHLLSGGLRSAIVPLALQLAVPTNHVHAVSVTTDSDGTFSVLDGEQPLSTQQGKPAVVHRLALRTPIVMIGDGSTDAAVRGVVNTFIAYTGVARRANVVAVADAEANSFEALHALLFE